jgi:hypothetical protein
VVLVFPMPKNAALESFAESGSRGASLGWRLAVFGSAAALSGGKA